jgi:hypothetical protein
MGKKRHNDIKPEILEREKKRVLTHSMTHGDREGETTTSHTN